MRSPGRILPSLVRRGARALAAGLVETTAGLRFPTNTPTDDGTVEEYSGDLYDGALGAVAALEAAHEMNSRGPWRETAGRAFRDAAAALRLSKIRHGLHGGDGGFVATALQVAHRRQDRSALAHAIAVGDALRSATFSSGDLFFGAAGTGIAFLHLQRATGEAKWLAAARAAIDYLGDHALAQRHGVAWHWDGDRGQHHDDVQTGFAHGSAGIVTFLAAAVSAGVRTRAARTLLREGSEWLDSTAVWDGDCGMWPVSNHHLHERHHWCHGSTGIARSYLARSRAGEPGALGKAGAAGSHAWTATIRELERTRTREPVCHCHGVAGLIELCADLDRAVPGGPWRARAEALVRHVSAVAGPGSKPSMLGTKEFGLGTGVAGVVLVLARLSGATMPAADRIDTTPPLHELLRTPPHRRAPAARASALATRHAPLVAPVVGVPMEGFPRRLLEVAHYREADRVAATALVLASDGGAPMRLLIRDLEPGLARLRQRFAGLLGPQAVTLAAHRPLLADLFGLLVLAPATEHERRHRVDVARYVARLHLRALGRMLARVERDVKGCLRGRAQGPLVSATPERGEPHGGQQRVFRLEFADGTTLAYKPRDVRVDWHVAGANEVGGLESGAMLVNRALARCKLASRVSMHDIVPGSGRYGYAEWISAPADPLPSPVARRAAAPHRRLRLEPYTGLQLADHAAANEFWRSAGALAFHLAAFGVGDMHRENLLVGSSRSGGHAALHAIDLENAFCVLDSLADTGLVPHAGDALVPAVARDHTHVGLDVRLPAFCEFGSRDCAFSEADGEADGGLQLLPDLTVLGTSHVMNGVCNPDGSSGHAPYLGALLRGLVDVWQAVRSVRSSLGRRLAHTAADLPARVLVRHTATYMPPWRERMTGRSRGLDRLANAAYPARPFAPEERAQLDALDVPSFFRRVGSPEIWWSPRGEGRAALASVAPPMASAKSPAECIAAYATARQLARAIVDIAAFELPAGPVDVRDDEHGVRVVRARDEKRFDVVVLMPDGPAQIALLSEGEVVHWGLPAR